MLIDEVKKLRDEYERNRTRLGIRFESTDVLCAKLDRFISAYEPERETSTGRWINVKDRLLGYEMMVIVYSELCSIGFAYLDGDEKWYGDCYEDVLYWMPLPELPED